MFGLGDMQITAALAGCLGITLFAVVYGAMNWNRGSDSRREAAKIRCRRIARERRRRSTEEQR